MGLFDLSATTGVKESGRFLQPGIHKAKFVSVEPGTINSQKTGQDYNTMKLTLDIEGYGEFVHNFFEPTSAERTANTFGQNPSPVEQFMISVRQIVDALSPTIGEMIDTDNVVVNGKKVNLKELNFSLSKSLLFTIERIIVGTEWNIVHLFSLITFMMLAVFIFSGITISESAIPFANKPATRPKIW